MSATNDNWNTRNVYAVLDLLYSGKQTQACNNNNNNNNYHSLKAVEQSARCRGQGYGRRVDNKEVHIRKQMTKVEAS